MKRTLVIILLGIAIINLLMSLQIFVNGKKYLEVNSENQEIIYKALEKEVKDIYGVKKVAVGQGINNDKLYVYYSLGEIEELKITEGKFNANIPIDSYIRENGYEINNIAIILSGISIVIIITIIISKARQRSSEVV